MAELLYQRPYLYPKQEAAIFTDRRWSLVEASTKAGKTVASIVWIIEEAFKAPPYSNHLWVAPVSSQAAIAFTRLKQGLPAGTFIPKETPTPRLELPNKAVIWCKSGDNPDSIYGEDYHSAVIDEASRSKEDVWYAVRSTLTATSGRAVIIGNVKGKKNWFYEWARRAEKNLDPNAHYARITVLDAIAAGVISVEEVEDARRNLPEHVFNELYMAIPAADSGNPFGEDHIYSCLISKLSSKPPVAFGVDLAKKADWLVIIGLDADGQVCVFERWRGISWRESIKKIHLIIGEDVPVLVDSTGVGDPVLEELQHEHGNFKGYHFTAVSKQRLMEGLAVSIQGHEIGILDGQIKNELLAFEYNLTPTGVRYQAADGYTDDCVCALALAREIWSTSAPGATLIKYYEQQIKNQITPNTTLSEENPILNFGFNRRISPEIVNNELTQLYENTLAKYSPKRIGCQACGHEVIGPSRITDGEFVWHVGCANMNRAA